MSERNQQEHAHAHTHEHGHGHGHDHSHAHQDVETLNVDHFNKTANTYEDNSHVRELTAKQAEFILTQYAFDPNSTTMLDFACGTGLMDKDLVSSVKRIQGVDISQGMVDEYNKRAAELNLADKMNATVIKLKGEEGELNGEKFDVVLCTMAYHHFENPSEITKLLAFFLKPGGWLMITDLLDQGEGDKGIPAEFKHVAHRHGFQESEMVKMFEGAGLEDVSFRLIPGAILDAGQFSASMAGQTSPLFLHKGRKAAL